MKYNVLRLILFAVATFIILSAIVTAQTNIEIFRNIRVQGKATVIDTLDVDGDIDLDGDGFDVDVTSGFSVDGDAASNVTVAGAGIDLTLESEAGRLILKGDEAAANGITIDANDVATTGLDIDVGSVSGMTIDGGLVNIGGGSGATADGDNDLLVAGDVEVDTTLDVDGTLTIGQADNVVTGAQTITPTQTYYHFSPTAVTTVTLATGSAVEGDLLIIHNLVSTSTVIVDTGATQGGGNVTLGQDDLAGFIYGDGVWVELFSPDNS